MLGERGLGLVTRYLEGIGATAPVALAGMALTAFASLGFLHRRRERRRLAASFPPPMREKLERGDGAPLAPSRRLITALCADLRDFTGLAETLPPDAVAEMLREYLTETSGVVFRHGGAVITCVGDYLVAIYNAPVDDPDHAASAVRSALELQELTLQISARWQERLGTVVRSGIGIATGPAVVGTMGPDDRLAYTALGATVDLAGHLQALTAEYGAAIVVSDATRRGLGADIHTRRLGEARGPGAAPPVTVHGVLPADIRKQPRAVLEVAATLVLLGAGQTCLVTTRDVGEGGMALGGVPAAWVPGTRVEIRCEGGLLPRPLLAEGVIAWRRGDEAGISFEALDPETAPTVAEYVTARGRRSVAGFPPLC
jgi:class 3 adenylate cyclase